MKKPKPKQDPCRCGCDLTVGQCEALFRLGVPSEGLTMGQAGLLISKAEANDWVLPESFAFARNHGEWVERRWKGKKV